MTQAKSWIPKPEIHRPLIIHRRISLLPNSVLLAARLSQQSSSFVLRAGPVAGFVPSLQGGVLTPHSHFRSPEILQGFLCGIDIDPRPQHDFGSDDRYHCYLHCASAAQPTIGIPWLSGTEGWGTAESRVSTYMLTLATRCLLRSSLMGAPHGLVRAGTARGGPRPPRCPLHVERQAD